MTPSRSHGQAEWIRRVVLVLVLCAGAQAQEFAGGTGTPEDPYQIATPEQFRQISHCESPDKYFVLVADIDCSGMNQGLSFSSFGFDGVLDGNSHVLQNLMPAPTAQAQTLFSGVGSRGIIRNLTVENCHTYSRADAAVGVLCGTNYGQILNCHVHDCVVSTEGKGDTGILAGINLGLMEDCEADAVTIISLNSSSCGGGLVGHNQGIMRYCAAEGSVFGAGNIGGLAGTNVGEIEACCARAAVTAERGGETLGGLVAVNRGSIANCYATGCVWGGRWQGGLAGLQQAGEITHCYSTGPVFSFYGQEGKPLVGDGDAASLRQCYYLSASGSTYPPNTLGTALSFTEMMCRENYTDWGFFDEDPNQPWLVPGAGLPRLTWEFERDIPVVAGLDVNEAQEVLGQHGWQTGEVRSDYSRQVPAERVIWTFPSRRAMPGTPIDIVVSRGAFDWSAVLADPNAGAAGYPLRIRTAGELEALRDLPPGEARCIELAVDIDMVGRVFSGALLGTTGSGEKSPGFAGSLHGNGFEIRNLSIRTSLGGCPGLVGCLAASGRITNLHLRRTVLTGQMPCGGETGGALAGRNDGMIQGCHVQDLFSAGVTGGLVGWNYGTVEQCSSVHGFIHAGEAGGLVGWNDGTVDQCFSDVRVVSGGGLVYQNLGRLTNSYTRGAVLGRGGTLAGVNSGDISCCYASGAVVHDEGSVSLEIVAGSGGRIADCYYWLPFGYMGPPGPAGIPLRDAQMRRRSSFHNWHFWGVQTDGFADLWFMPAEGHPLLMWQCAGRNLPVIPPVVNLYVYEALFRLQSAGIAATARYEFDDGVPRSHVIRAEASSAPGDRVAVEVVASLGPCNWANNRGDGSEANPFTICLASQLFSLAEHPELWDRHFVLTADLDLGWTSVDGALIAADANAIQADFQGPRFNGVFDGAGHRLGNLTISSRGSYLGLFGALGPGARITRLHVDYAYVAGAPESKYVGPIAGTSEGVLEDCHTSGWISGGGYVGALVGYATGTIEGCTSTIEGYSWAGGRPKGH